MRFLIDECLHTSLVEVAHVAGHEATHVVHLGLKGTKDWDLMPRIVEHDYTFVTNNARDFRKLYAKEELHGGLLIVVPQVRPEVQRQLFELVLSGLSEPLVNEIIEIDLDGGEVVITTYPLPV